MGMARNIWAGEVVCSSHGTALVQHGTGATDIHVLVIEAAGPSNHVCKCNKIPHLSYCHKRRIFSLQVKNKLPDGCTQLWDYSRDVSTDENSFSL
jgi:hypothetical protein